MFDVITSLGIAAAGLTLVAAALLTSSFPLFAVGVAGIALGVHETFDALDTLLFD